MLRIVTLLWQPNENSEKFSSMYNPLWVEKLYRGFKRNLTVPFEFICYVDREYEFKEDIKQASITSKTPSYADCIQPYELDVPMILVGLDTIITGNCDHLAEYCMTADKLALPRDPYCLERACNGVSLVPAGFKYVFTGWNGENDMDYIRTIPHVFSDDLWPGDIVSYKGTVKLCGLNSSKIVYFHGQEKAHTLSDEWVSSNWI